MEPHNKHSRSNEEPTMSHSLPNLSTLPELVLFRILSLMDPKEAVQTCILSKQWRNLWTWIPSLNFNKHGCDTDVAFVHFVSSMLYLHGVSKLDTFRLCWHAGQHKANIGSEDIRRIYIRVASAWIYSALSCKPLVISLDLRRLDDLKLPLALFTCDSLKQLELQLSYKNSGEAIESKYMNLPNLKKLKCSWFILNDPVMNGLLF